jgi:hypothetical protein
MTSTTQTHRSTFTRLSLVSVLIAGASVGYGVVTGLITYLDRSPVREVHSSDTAAWWPHLAILAAVVIILVVARLRMGPGRLGSTLIAPLGRSGLARLMLTARTGRVVRLLCSAPLLALLVYSGWRTGEQITAGLDPNFTANAWGGPSYLGAMFCHYLDGGLLIAAAALLLNVILVRTQLGKPDDTADRPR